MITISGAKQPQGENMSATSQSAALRQPGNLQGILLVSLGLLSTMAVVLLAPAVPSMMAAFGGPQVAAPQVIFSLTCPALCVALLSPFAGMIIDRIGRRKLLIGSLIAYPLFGTAPLYLTSLNAIIASRLGVGVAETVLMSASITMLGDFFSDHQREKFLAMNTGIASLSATLFFAVGGLLAATEWRLPYAVYGVAVLFLLAVLAFTWEPEHHHTRRELDTAAMATGPFPLFTLLAICVVTVAGGIVFMLPQIEIGVISAAHGFTSPATAGMIGAIGSVAMPVGAFTFAQLRKFEVPVPVLVVLAFVLGGAGLITMAAMNTLPLLTLGMIIHEFGCGFMLTGLMTWVLGLLTYEYRGKGTGAYFSSFFIAQPISGFLFGVVQNALHGDPLSAFYAFGTAAVVVAIVLAVVISTGVLQKTPRAA